MQVADVGEYRLLYLEAWRGDACWRNLTCLDLEQLHLEFHLALGRIRQEPRLMRSFFHGAELPV